MATKKAGSTAKKTVKKSPAAKPSTTTKVTTVTAKTTAPAHAQTRRPVMSRGNTALAAALIAELVGTFLLTVAILGTKGDPLYTGFAIAGIVFMVVAVSGAHLNPAVTVGAWVTRKVSSLRALLYIVAQILGAGLAYTVLKAFLDSGAQASSQAAAMGQSAQLFRVAELTDKNQWTVFFVELLAAAIFTFGVAEARRQTERTATALGVGLSLLVAGIFGTIAAGYVMANTIFNPAVAVALQAVDFNNFGSHIVSFAAYMIAPLVGGVIGFGLRDVLTLKKDV